MFTLACAAHTTPDHKGTHTPEAQTHKYTPAETHTCEKTQTHTAAVTLLSAEQSEVSVQ